MKIWAMLGGLLAATVVVACAVGQEPVAWSEVVAALLGRPVSDDTALIVLALRLPRVALAGLVGAALSLAGVALQGLFHNPLADPHLLGISAGGALGAAAALVLGPAAGAVLGPAGWAFVGCAVALLLVWRLGQVGGVMPLAGLLLAGVAVGLTLSAGLSAVLLVARSQAGDVVLWLMGHLAGARWSEVAVVAGCTAVGGVVLLLKAADLNAFLLGEDAARSLGVAVERSKGLLLAATAVLVAGAVAFAGLIGFVGLIVPHAVRFLVGADHRRLLPAAALAGASTLILADLAARSVLPGELPVGVLTGAVGGPFFLVLLRRSLRA